jgi:hypothetical protein
MNESGSASDLRDSWDRAAAILRREHSISGYCDLYEQGEMTTQEVLGIAFQHCVKTPELCDALLTSLANHTSEEMRDLVPQIRNLLRQRKK